MSFCRLLAFFLLFFPFYCAHAQGLNPASEALMSRARQAGTAADVAALLEELANAPAPQVFWRDAVLLSQSDHISTPAGRAAIVRLMAAALHLSGHAPMGGALDRLTEGDIAAMRRVLHFPGPENLLIYLLQRGPALTESFTPTAQYVIIRFLVNDHGVRLPEHVFFESASNGYRGLSPELNITFTLPPGDDVTTEDRERARTAKLNLSALPALVLAAKAAAAAERADVPDGVYADLVALYALRQVYRHNGTHDFRILNYNAESHVVKGLRARFDADPFLTEVRETLEVGRADRLFQTRYFTDASEEYDRVARATVGADQVKAIWGRAMAELAKGQVPRNDLNTLAHLLTPDMAKQTALFYLLLNHLPSADLAPLRDAVPTWRARIEATPTPDEDVALEFLRLMQIMGRPDIAIPLQLERVRASHGTEQDFTRLIRLAAFLRDSCGVISFRMSGDGRWQRRATEGYDPLLDFLHNVNTLEPDSKVFQT